MYLYIYDYSDYVRKNQCDHMTKTVLIIVYIINHSILKINLLYQNYYYLIVLKVRNKNYRED